MADTNTNDETLPHPTGEQATPPSHEPGATPEPSVTSGAEETAHHEDMPAGQTWEPVEESPSRDRGPIELDAEAEAAEPEPAATSVREAAESDEGVSEFLMESAATDGEGAVAAAAGKPVKMEKRPRDTVMIVNDAPGDECRIA